MNPKDLIELVCAFARIDKNSDGKLSKSEFEELFKINGMSLNDLDDFVSFNFNYLYKFWINKSIICNSFMH